MSLLNIFLDYQARLLLWMVGSVALYALTVNLLDYGRRRPRSRLGRLVTRLDFWPHRFWLDQVLRFAYYVGLPFLALIKGAMSLRLLGLSELQT